MNRRARRLVVLASLAGLGALLLWAFIGLPPAGIYVGPYGDVVNDLAPRERHVENAVTAVNFDVRGLDTLGEEFILFAAVSGVLLLFREESEEEEEKKAPGPSRSQGDARRLRPKPEVLRSGGALFAAATVVFGIYVLDHATLTPGGAFQGGAILGTGALLVFLSLEYRAFERAVPPTLAEVAEAAGAAGYALTGLATLAAGGAFLENLLPLGERGDLLSGGTVLVIDLAAGLEVAGAFTVLFAKFLAETRRHAREALS